MLHNFPTQGILIEYGNVYHAYRYIDALRLAGVLRNNFKEQKREFRQRYHGDDLWVIEEYDQNGEYERTL